AVGRASASIAAEYMLLPPPLVVCRPVQLPFPSLVYHDDVDDLDVDGGVQRTARHLDQVHAECEGLEEGPLRRRDSYCRGLSSLSTMYWTGRRRDLYRRRTLWRFQERAATHGGLRDRRSPHARRRPLSR